MTCSAPELADVPLSKLARVFLLAGEGARIADIRRKVRLPQALVSRIVDSLETAEEEAAKDTREATETERRIFRAVTAPPCYNRDAQNNIVPPDPRHFQPGPSGAACHTLPWGQVDPDYLEDRARGITQTAAGG